MFIVRIHNIMRWIWYPIMRLAKDMLGGISDLPRLLVRPAHFKLMRRHLVWMQWLAVSLSHFQNYALEVAPDHAVSEWPAGGYVGFNQISGQGHTHQINVLGFRAYTMVAVNCLHTHQMPEHEFNVLGPGHEFA